MDRQFHHGFSWGAWSSGSRCLSLCKNERYQGRGWCKGADSSNRRLFLHLVAGIGGDGDSNGAYHSEKEEERERCLGRVLDFAIEFWLKSCDVDLILLSQEFEFLKWDKTVG